MTISLVITEVRTDITTPFFEMPAEWISYVQRYNSIRKGSGGIAEYSEDLLTKTYREQYASEYDRETFLNDPIVKMGMDAKIAYNSANNITRTVDIS